MLVGCVSFVGDQIGCVSCLRTRLLLLPPRVAFFLTLEMHVVIACLCLLLLTPLALSLSAEGHSCLDKNTLSLSLLRRSLAWSVCSGVPTGQSRSPPPAAHTLRIALIFSPRKASAAAGRPTSCATVKGFRADIDRAVLRAVATATMPPPILLLSRALLVESPRRGEN
jgi:hypothetical protein